LTSDTEFLRAIYSDPSLLSTWQATQINMIPTFHPRALRAVQVQHLNQAIKERQRFKQ
jgi:hypothetical protein